MEDLFEQIFKPIIRFSIGFLRLLLFIGWELMVEIIGRTIGWGFYRIISLGRFPKKRLNELEEATFLVKLLVEMTGLLLLLVLIVILSRLV